MKTTINNWVWEIEDPGFLEYWFSDYEQYLKENSIKSNPERDVFTIVVEGKIYYVKYSHPTSLLQKTRSKINPKSAAEFNSAKLLEESGVPTPKVMGWGKKGTESMLVTEAVPEAINTRQYWFAIEYRDFAKRKTFLAKFANFLKHFLESGFYHPDFHLGNLLIRENGEKLSFILIDPYGVVDEDPLSEKKKMEMLCIIGALRGEINDQTGIDLVEAIIPEFDEEKAADIWQEILISESMKTMKLWEKRQDRILTDLRYSQLLGNDDLHVRIRKNFAGELCLNLNSPADIVNHQDDYDLQEMDAAEAKRAWLKSFQEEFHRIPTKKPLAWVQGPAIKDCLIYETEIKTVLSQEEIDFRTKLAGL